MHDDDQYSSQQEETTQRIWAHWNVVLILLIKHIKEVENILKDDFWAVK